MMKVWIEKNQGKLWFSIFINIIVLFTLMAVYKPLYENNDDMAIISLVGGVKGVFDAHLVHMSRVIGYILKLLYSMNAGIPWYALLQYAFLFAAFTGITYVFLNKLKHASSLPIVLLFLYFFGYEGYVHIQFTKSAGIITVAGGALLFWALFQEKIPAKAYISGFLLALFGSFYRVDQFWCEIALLTGFGVLFLFRLKEFEKEIRFRRLGVCMFTFLTLIAIAFGIFKVDRYMYDTSEDWEYYMDHTKARAELWDHAFPDYEENAEAYKAVGIDEITFEMFETWTHQDPDKVTLESMQSIIALKQPKAIDMNFFKTFAKVMLKGVWKITSFGFCVLLGILWLLRGEKSIASIVTIVYEAGMVILLYLYLFYNDRYFRNRVDIGIWIAVAVLLIWLLDTGKRILPAAWSVVLMTVVLAVTLYRWGDELRMNQMDVKERFQAERTVIEEIDADDEHLYLTKVFTISFAKAYDIFDSIPVGIGDNMYPLGGWTAQTVPYMDVLEKYGVDNPFRDIINNEKVYLIDQNIDMTMEYIHTWYDEDAEAVPVKQIGKHSVYKIVSE